MTSDARSLSRASFDRLGPRLLRWLVFTTIMVALALGLAGRSDQPLLNLYLGILALFGLVAMFTTDPDLLGERFKRGQVGADPVRLAALRVLFVAHLVIGLLDVGRLPLSPPMRFPVQAAGLGLLAIALGWVLWALAVNRFFVPVIRVQPERGQHVVQAGPYGVMRHPGYAGMVLAAPASALALGSWAALVPALVASILFVRRTAHEDRFLREHLNGYAAYAARVRWRLVPGVW
jgi:protein-S-isoprenylcysteine O-methyltransferase Ste14